MDQNIVDCDAESEKFLSKFYIRGNPVFAKILWRISTNQLFHMQVFSEQKSWSGDFTYGMCTAFGENFDENDIQYSNNVKYALKIKNEMYTYDLTPEGESHIVKFYWKRRFAGSSATIVHGFVTLRRDEVPGTKNDIIDFLLNENKILCQSVEDYKNETVILKKDLENWKNEFEKFIVMKNSLETTLYGKFVQLLNSKKRRIRELEEHLN